LVVTLLLTALLSVAAPLMLGWEWTVLAGIVGGLVSQRRSGWLVGGGGAALGWAALVVYTAAVAPASLRVLADTLSSLAGNIPGAALVGLTVLLGGLLGALGGGIGSVLRSLAEHRMVSVN
jgi:hypothetical protein